MTRQTSLQVTEATERQAKALQSLGFGSFTDVVRLAVDRMFQTEVREMSAFDAAKIRVGTTPALAKHETVIFADWPEGDEHWAWIASAPVGEIVAWAETAEADA